MAISQVDTSVVRRQEVVTSYADVPSRLRPCRAATGAGCLGAVIATVWWSTGSPADAVRTALSSKVDFEHLVTTAAALAIWVCIAWFAAVVVIEAAAVVPGAAGRISRRFAARFGPAFLRRSARWLIGITLVAGPLVSGPAMAAQSSNGTAPAVSYPNLDRPVATAPVQPAAAPATATAGTTAAPAHASPTSGYPTGAALDLDRPSAAYLPPPPPVAVRTTSDDANPRSSGSRLLTGNPHREVPDDAYVVRSGDALWDIAARHLGPDATPADIAREWPRWYAANRAVIGTNPSLIRPGTVLHVPQN
jgi:resuscitation-promoting factor RpfA